MVSRAFLSFGFSAFTLVSVAQAFAQDQSVMLQSVYAGSAICEQSEIGLLLTIRDDGPMLPEEFDDPCRSGSGPCNDKYARDFENTRHVRGDVSFFPLARHPDAHKGSYEVTGTGLRWGPHKRSVLTWEGFKAMSHEAIDTLNITYELTVTPGRRQKYTNSISDTGFRVSTVTNIDTGKRESFVTWTKHGCGTVRLSELTP